MDATGPPHFTCHYHVHKRSVGSGGGVQWFKASCATCASHAQRAIIQLCHVIITIQSNKHQTRPTLS